MIFVAGAGNREVAMCDGGDISWQAQYFVRVRRVDAERFVAGAGNREVVSCGRGECRSSIGISVWRVVFLGCWMWPCHWDLRFRVWHRSSVFVTSLS